MPSPTDEAYADAHGIGDIAAVAEEFRDYHLGRGTLMLDWAAAWRTWCRNQVRWGKATLKKPETLLNGHDESDPYGALAFAAGCKFAKPGTAEDGRKVPSVAGWDLVGVLLDVCEAAGVPTEWRGDLQPVAIWLRDGVEPDAILDTIRGHKPPRVPGSWWWYDKRVRASAKHV